MAEIRVENWYKAFCPICGSEFLERKLEDACIAAATCNSQGIVMTHGLSKGDEAIAVMDHKDEDGWVKKDVHIVATFFSAQHVPMYTVQEVKRDVRRGNSFNIPAQRVHKLISGMVSPVVQKSSGSPAPEGASAG